MSNQINDSDKNYYNGKFIKPIAEIEKLITHLQFASNNIETTGRQRINYMENGRRNIYLLHEGSVALYRSSDGMILNSETAPFIFGISNQQTDPSLLFMRSQEPSRLSRISISDADAIISERNLWEYMVRLMTYTARLAP